MVMGKTVAGDGFLFFFFLCGYFTFEYFPCGCISYIYAFRFWDWIFLQQYELISFILICFSHSCFLVSVMVYGLSIWMGHLGQ